MLDKKEIEYYTQPHHSDDDGKGHAEGAHDIKPSHTDIIEALEGYVVTDIEVWYDDLQGFYRWDATIEKA